MEPVAVGRKERKRYKKKQKRKCEIKGYEGRMNKIEE